MGLIRSTDVNSGRQSAVDIAKTLSIFFMVIIHTMEGTDIDTSCGLGYVFDSILGAQFGAPVFMACMGIGLTFSHRSDARTMAHRGWVLFLAGYLLNLAKAIPSLILGCTTGDAEYYTDFVYDLTNIDILQFAGMAFLTIALCKRIGLDIWWTTAVAIVMLVFGSVVNMVDTGHIWLNILLSPFIGIKSELVCSDFPLVNWFLFVIAGYWFGRLLKRVENTNELYGVLGVIGSAIYLTYTAYAIPAGKGMYGEEAYYFYDMRALDFEICICAILMSLSFSHFLSLLLDRISPATERFSQRLAIDLTKIYIAQWLIIKWFVEAPMTNYMGLTFGPWESLGIGIVVLVLSVLFSRLKPLSLLKI